LKTRKENQQPTRANDTFKASTIYHSLEGAREVKNWKYRRIPTRS